MRKTELIPAIEAALFMSNEPLSLKDMARMFSQKEENIREIIDQMKELYKKEEHGIYVLETPQGFQLKVKPSYVHMVRPLTPYQDLSRGLLKVLAIVAYKQPVTQSDIVKVIGNRTYDYVKKLTDKGLIKPVKHGRTKALVPTKEFANYFGVESEEDLKKLFKEMKNDEKRDEQPGSDVPDRRTEDSD